jgi:hypothetical protein
MTDVDTPVSNLVVSATTLNSSLGTATAAGNGATNTVTYAPRGLLGTNTVNVIVQDGSNKSTNSFIVVTTASQPPTLAAIAPQSTPRDISKSVPLNVTPATGIPGFTFTGSNTNKALLSSITFTTTANTAVANLNVVSNMVGFDQVTITVSDGKTNSVQTFALTVTPTGVVTMGPIPTQSTAHDVFPKVALTVNSPDTAVNNLHYTGSSTNSLLVSGFSFAFNGRQMVATINLFTNRGGDDFVTISATDGFSTASQSFILHVSQPPGQVQLFVSASGGKLTLSLQGAANTPYTIQGSTNLAQSPLIWNTITNVTSDASGKASFTTTPSPSIPRQFIRAKNP